MRVLHVIPSLSPRRGGPTEAVIEMVRALNARGIDAEIATTDEDLSPALDPVPIDHRGVPVRFFPRRFARTPLFGNFTCSPAFASWLDAKIDTYDLLHVHALFSHLPTTAMRTARRRGMPYINRPLGMLGHWPLRQSALRKRAYLRLVERANLQHAAALHFVSASEQAEAADLRLTAPGVVIPHGVPVPLLLPQPGRQMRQRFGLPPDRPIVLFLGRLHAKKGLDLLLRALALLPEPRPVLLIAGEGPERASLEKLEQELHLRQDIRWLGFVEGKVRQLCLQGADLFALTSHHENLGMAVLEALASGTPVLLSPPVALANAVTRHRLGVVVPLEIHAVRDGLVEGLTHMKTGPDCAVRRSFVETEHDWPANARALAELYAKMVEYNGSRRTRSR
jgi:glycosyltransferase involved in cell wall biosynthesis